MGTCPKLSGRLTVPGLLSLLLILMQPSSGIAQQGGSRGAVPPSPALEEEVAQYVTVNASVFALTHVRVIDGTGAAAREDQTILVDHGVIQQVGPSTAIKLPAGVLELDRSGQTVLPGLVGMHDHLFYTAPMVRNEKGKLPPPGYVQVELPFTAPHLYLAAGVTTIRTTGSISPDSDMSIKRMVDSGRMPGPHILPTAPYLDGPDEILAFYPLVDADDARRRVAFYAADGFTSWKLYMKITRAEAAAVISEAHHRGMKVTGHLCSLTWHEAIALGIDNLEHGPVYSATDLVPGKLPDSCPDGREASWEGVEIGDPRVQGLIQDLIQHGVAVTSTLPVFEASLTNKPPSTRVLQAMAADSKISFLNSRSRMTPELNIRWTAALRKEMQFEHAFASAGGMLLAGPDPTGNGGVLPGYGDWRELELLVEDGFTPIQAIHIATANGAAFLGESSHFGTVESGKRADLIVVDGDPSRSMEDIEKTVLVFKDGVGYDSRRLFDSVRGLVGIK